MKTNIFIIFLAVLTLSLPVQAAAQMEEGVAGVLSARYGYLGGSDVRQGDFFRTINIDEETYLDTPLEKGAVGIINLATSWVEVPSQMSAVAEEDNLIAGWTYGMGKGIVYGLVRGVAGLADMATFIFPPYDQPMLMPEYEVKKPQEEGFKIKILQW